MAAIFEKGLGIGLLEIAGADLRTRDMRGDGKYGRIATMSVIKSVDQMHIPRTAAADAYSQLAGELGFCAGCESCDFLMPIMQPADGLVFPDLVGDGIGGVAYDPMQPADPGSSENFDHHLCDLHVPAFIQITQISPFFNYRTA